jgi:hypothetical protein
MSSRKAATAKSHRRNGAKAHVKAGVKAHVKPAARAATKPAKAEPGSAVAAAEALAADIQRALAAGNLDVLTPQALQTLMTAACRLYSAQVEGGSETLPVREVTPTDIMVTASGLMRAGNLAVFELGMWQSWTGR